MNDFSWLQLLFLVTLLAVSSPLVGAFIARTFDDDSKTNRLEDGLLRLLGVDSRREQRWRTYATSLLAFSVVSIAVVYVIQRTQAHLLLNPDGQSNVDPLLAFNTAVSFATNTNWQNYGGEFTMSLFTQMSALAVQNFVSAAVGLTVAIALIRGLFRSRSETIGNFWVDLVKGVVRILLPLAFVAAIVLSGSGVIQNLHRAETVTTLEGVEQTIPQGPVASQEAIKELGQNGGGFFNANSAHPYENPNGFTNLFEIWLILAIPFAMPFAFGRLVKDKRQGFVILGTMVALWMAATLLLSAFESSGTMEGKETRFGQATCALFASSTTATSTGAVNCAHDSLTPMGGGIALINMMLGEVSPGGTGSGLYGMLVFAILTVFLAGLMVGRTPEYLGKKIQATEMKLIVLYLLFVPVVVLGLAGASLVTHPPVESLANSGPHGLTEMIYAFVSASNNNGSAFGGLTGATDFFNVALAVCMFVGRFFSMVVVLAIAGSLARKQVAAPSAGTFPTGTPLFAGLLTAVVIVIVGLTYFPVLALGPIVEHLQGGF
jgi:K+-transporting ATPase ATPase A chain